MAQTRAEGRVVDWKDQGFGFITPDDGTRDVFFHISDVEAGPVTKNARVSYGVTITDKGQRAVQVRTLLAPPQEPQELEADVLSADALWAELEPTFRAAVIAVARDHNWLE